MVIDGKYEVVLDSPIARQKVELDLVTIGSQLTGTVSGAMGTLHFIDGVVDGTSLRWSVEGPINAIYAQNHLWEWASEVAGDSISGVAKMGHLGSAPFEGVRVDASGSAKGERAALPWTDLGLPRYESISVEWVKALQAYVKEKTKNKVVDFEVVWSCEYTNPPAHLLRGDGNNTIGYHFRAKDGKFEAFDGPLPGADIYAVFPYTPFAQNLRMNTDQYVAWVREHGAEYKDQVTNTGDISKSKLISDLMAGTGNDIREEFLSQQTL